MAADSPSFFWCDSMCLLIWPVPPLLPIDMTALHPGLLHLALNFRTPLSSYSSSSKCSHTFDVFLRLLVPVVVEEVLAQVEEFWEVCVYEGGSCVYSVFRSMRGSCSYGSTNWFGSTPNSFRLNINRLGFWLGRAMFEFECGR
jgi:hypothetical protein